MVKSKGDLLGINKNYSIQNLEGKELVFMKFTTREKWNEESKQYESKIYYDVHFSESGAKASLFKGFGLREKGAIKMLLKNNLILENSIDPAAEARYISVNNGSYGTKEHASRIAKSNSPLVIDGNKITQDGKLIGKFIEKLIVLDSSEELKVLTVYSEGGEKIGVAEVPVVDPMEWNVQTFSDGKITGLLYESPMEKEKLFEWLIDKEYFN